MPSSLPAPHCHGVREKVPAQTSNGLWTGNREQKQTFLRWTKIPQSGLSI